MKSFTFKGTAARRRREALGLRATQVAEQVGVTASHIRGLETGRQQPAPDTYLRICKALAIDPDELREEREPAEGVA